MKKIELKGRKHWDIFSACTHDQLIIGAVLSASGTDWDIIEKTLDGDEIAIDTLRVYSGKRRAAKLRKLLCGMQELGIFHASMSMEVHPHR